MSINVESFILKTKSFNDLKPTELAKVLKYLISIELKPGGPYLPKFIDENKFNRHISKLIDNSRINTFKEKESATDLVLYSEVELELNKLTVTDKTVFRHILKKIKQADFSGEISTINRTFAKSIITKQAKLLPDNNLRLLDKANIYVWMAYTLYDDVIDENEINLVPYANILMRQAIRIYLDSGIEIDFLYKEFNKVDIANENELNLRNIIRLNERNKSDSYTAQAERGFERLLYEKSILHCAGLKWQATKYSNENASDLNLAFNLYCSSRQLNDDIHDWRKDYERNQPTYTVYKLIEGMYSKNQNQIIKDMQLLFWKKELENQCNKIKSDIQKSIDVLSKVMDTSSPFINRFIMPIYNSAEDAIRAHKYDIKFLAEYKKINSDLK